MTDNFSQNDKAQQKTDLAMEFGMRIAPLNTLARAHSTPSLRDYQTAFALLHQDNEQWYEHVCVFTTVSGIRLEPMSLRLATVFFDVLDSFENQLGSPATSPQLQLLQRTLGERLGILKQDFRQLIDMIPIDWNLTLSEADKPFTFYMHVLDLVSGTRQRLHYLDRYLKPDFFRQYLRNLDPKLEIRLVTTHGKTGDDYGIEGVRAVSSVFKQEFKNYQLVELPQSEFHGRQLRIDEQVFLLDASTSDAGKYPTAFGPIANAVEANRIVDDLILKGKVIDKS